MESDRPVTETRPDGDLNFESKARAEVDLNRFLIKRVSGKDYRNPYRFEDDRTWFFPNLQQKVSSNDLKQDLPAFMIDEVAPSTVW